MSALTEIDQEKFGILAQGFTEHQENLALVRSQLDGHDVAVVVAVLPLEDGDGIDMTPLAVLVDDHLFDRLQDPASLVA